MDLKQFRYFIGICDAGSITKAAKTLYVAQPALSNHIANMEKTLGVELLHRSSHGVVPTEQGEILYAAAQRIMRDVSRIPLEVKALEEGPVGKVAIGVAEVQSNIFGQVFLQRITEKFPGIELHYSSGQSIDMYRKLHTGMIDIGLFYKEPEITGVDSKILLEEELFVATTYKHQKNGDKPENNPITFEELRKLPFMFPSKTNFSIRRIVENAFGGVDFTPQIVAEVDSFIATKKYVAMGLASTIMPWSALYEEVENKAIMLRRIEGVTISRNIELCLPEDRPQSNVIKVTSRVVTEVIKELINSDAWLYANLVEDSV